MAESSSIPKQLSTVLEQKHVNEDEVPMSGESGSTSPSSNSTSLKYSSGPHSKNDTVNPKLLHGSKSSELGNRIEDAELVLPISCWVKLYLNNHISIIIISPQFY